MRLIDADKIGLTDIEIIMCDGSYKKALEMLIDKINNAPTVEPKRGEWVYEEFNNFEGYSDGWWSCSKCGKGMLCDYYGPPIKTDYCPHCGAKMESEVDDK